MRTDVTLSEWIEALESGMYRKAIGALRLETLNGWRHCCLGVLCELAGTRWRAYSSFNLDMGSSKDIQPPLFGPEIGDLLMSWVDLDDDDHRRRVRRRVDVELMKLNDGSGDEDFTAVVKFLRNLP